MAVSCALGGQGPCGVRPSSTTECLFEVTRPRHTNWISVVFIYTASVVRVRVRVRKLYLKSDSVNNTILEMNASRPQSGIQWCDTKAPGHYLNLMQMYHKMNPKIWPSLISIKYRCLFNYKYFWNAVCANGMCVFRMRVSSQVKPRAQSTVTTITLTHASFVCILGGGVPGHCHQNS